VWLAVAVSVGMELVTTRCLIRDFGPDDVADMCRYASEPAVLRHTELGLATGEQREAFLRTVANTSQESPRTRYTMGVARRTDSVLIGMAELHVTSTPHKRAELGFLFGERHWGCGYATEVAAAMLRFGLADLGLHKVSALCDPENPAAVRVVKKIGMVQEARLREHVLMDGSWHDRLVFARLAHWE
jgi:[ribosomal protein S5]-alanine N-acetyltransferase